MSVWVGGYSTFKKVREVKADFAMWVAAAITVQRCWRQHSRGESQKRKLIAVKIISKNFRSTHAHACKYGIINNKSIVCAGTVESFFVM